MGLLTYDDLSDVLDNVKMDGRKRNLISDCPYCGKSHKFGVSLVKDGNPFNCFSCNESGYSMKLMSYLGRTDLIQEFFSVDEEVEDLLKIEDLDDEIDYELEEIELPPRTKRVADDEYLNSRGWWDESYSDFPVFRSKDFKFKDYVLLGVYMYGEIVGYVGRHTWSKKKINGHNRRAKADGTYQILRYRNSEGNDFGKMLGGFDLIEEDTDTVILVEGFMDIINITQELDLLESDDIRVVCTFGKKISQEQIFHLQEKEIKNVIVFYDDDACEDIKRMDLDKYFNVMIASTNDADNVKDGDDAGDLSCEQIEQCLSAARKPVEFYYDKVVIYDL